MNKTTLTTKFRNLDPAESMQVVQFTDEELSRIALAANTEASNILSDRGMIPVMIGTALSVQAERLAYALTPLRKSRASKPAKGTRMLAQ